MVEHAKRIVKLRGWQWKTGMKIHSGWGFGETALDKIDCSGAIVNDVLIDRPFSDKFMQCVREPVPDLSDEKTLGLIISRLRELWRYDVEVSPSGDGWAFISKGSQEWARTKPEALIVGFENLKWEEEKKGRYY
jgi:hypothetical protein